MTKTAVQVTPGAGPELGFDQGPDGRLHPFHLIHDGLWVPIIATDVQRVITIISTSVTTLSCPAGTEWATVRIVGGNINFMDDSSANQPQTGVTGRGNYLLDGEEWLVKICDATGVPTPGQWRAIAQSPVTVTGKCAFYRRP